MHGQPTPYMGGSGAGGAGGVGYIPDPYQMAVMNQQMSGLTLFEPELSVGPQQNFVFQVRDHNVVLSSPIHYSLVDLSNCFCFPTHENVKPACEAVECDVYLSVSV
uniref:Uncharacterized protein n=1 Tax=Trichobilharzia regenti TaxID=157069 RepID=A0AA85IZK2_TRIRE|nr:unnamed protein product [Trichobilharzia regenti]CAH8866448.1 unnamed protein product [Trichobilharzia regenti]CAH8866450.1 unnamed protein product [Trichobilharzia regenti]CAH8866452.1 unnamed protein product [Trichobilharzia regenti]